MVKKLKSVNIPPNFAKIAVGLQVFMACLILVVWGAWATWGTFPNSLAASGVVFGPTVLLCFVAMLGLWKGKMFGWVTAIIGSTIASLILCLASGPLCILPVGHLIFLLTPRVRDLYVRDYYK